MAWVLKQALTGYGLLRKPAGVTDGIVIFPSADQSPTTIDLLDGNGDAGLTPQEGRIGTFPGTPAPLGIYDAINDWYDNNPEAVPTEPGYVPIVEYVILEYTVPAGYVLTEASCSFELVFSGGSSPTAQIIQNLTTSETYHFETRSGDTTDTMTASDFHAIPGDVISFTVGAYEESGTATARITAISLTLVPFAEIQFSDDTGDTISPIALPSPLGSQGGDVDDFGAGVIMAGVAGGVWYTSAYTDTDALELTGLTGIDGAANVTCVRIPYRKLASQALNDDPESLQFIYGTSSAVSGKTLWGVTFDSSDGSIIAESDMTPIINSTTYYIVGKHALETSGADTRIILAFAKPVGGGDTKLIRSTNGGSSWAIANGLDGDYIKWAPGSTQRAWLSGAAGLRYTTNRGSTMQNKTAGTTGTILGVQGF